MERINNSSYVGCYVSDILAEEVERTVREKGYSSKSEFVRESLRDKIRAIRETKGDKA